MHSMNDAQSSETYFLKFFVYFSIWILEHVVQLSSKIVTKIIHFEAFLVLIACAMPFLLHSYVIWNPAAPHTSLSDKIANVIRHENERFKQLSQMF